MKQLIRTLLALLLVVVMAVNFASCAAASPVHASPRATKVVARAGDVEILYEELYFITMNKIAEMKAAHGEVVFADPARVTELKSFVKGSLLTEETALISLGYEYGIDVHEGDVAENVQIFMESLVENEFAGDRGAYIDSLDKSFMTDHYARSYFGIQNYLANEIVLAMLGKGELETSDERVRERILSDDFVRTVHVIVSKTNPAYTDEENKAHIAQLHAAITAKTDASERYHAFREAIGSKYNNDFNDLNGNGYYFARGEMEQFYEDAAFALQNDYDVSPVVESEDGYYIIMRLPKEESYIELNFQKLKEKSYFVTLNDKVSAKLAAMTLEMTPFGEGLDLTDLPAISAGAGSTMITVGVIAGVVLVVGVSVGVVFAVYKKKRAAKSK